MLTYLSFCFVAFLLFLYHWHKHFTLYHEDIALVFLISLGGPISLVGAIVAILES